MSLHKKLMQRAQNGNPIRVGVIGSGKFGSMYLSQIPFTPGIHLVGLADLDPQKAKDALRRVGWKPEQFDATTLEQAYASGKTAIINDAQKLLAFEGIDIIVEATGSPYAGVLHALSAIDHGKHIVMVNVEADALAGPLLAKKAQAAGVIYSFAYGDQPALIMELVDWARTAGFEVVCAGKGTKYLPQYHDSTPETVWDHYGFTQAQVAEGDFNAQMFNSFLDGTKSALEMSVVANACHFHPQVEGLQFPPCGVDDLARILRPQDEGGILSRRNTVEVVSSLERDQRPVFRDLRWGVYVVLEAPTDYVRKCFSEYGLITDPSGRYTAMYKPYHLIGLEVGISVASIALRGEATGCTDVFNADVVATAKRDLAPGEMLDGEGGSTVYGKLTPASMSISHASLPIGLASKMKLKHGIKKGHPVSWNDVEYDASNMVIKIRRTMETGQY